MKLTDEQLEALAERFFAKTGDGSSGVDAMRWALDVLPDHPSYAWPELRAISRAVAEESADAAIDRVASSTAVLSEEDMRLIREHVRPKDSGDAVEAAVLKERVRCVLLSLEWVTTQIMGQMLGGEEPVK